MNTNELLLELRKFVLIKSGLRNIDPAHCKTISEYVFQETKNYVSETTVKRFFGFANTLHKFSLFTLNSLSQYIGYDDWDSFCRDKESQTTSAQSIWHNLKLKAQAITEVSLISKKNNSGVPFNSTANRSFFYPDFDYFLKNNYQFTTISAQPGHGKSILIAHMVEHFFVSENAIYKNDIVVLLNSMSVNAITQSGLSLKDWFLKEFKFESLSEMISFFKKNPKERKGRFVIVVDGIDDVLAKSVHLNVFIDFLHSIEENNFVKLIFGLRTNTWLNLQPTLSGSAFLNKAWYTGLFYDEDTLSNVPPLNVDEILYTLSHIENKKVTKGDVSPLVLAQFKTPFWIQVYFTLKIEDNMLELSNPLLCYELINYFLEKKVFLAKQSTEKIYLSKKISGCISERDKKLSVPKEKILDYINCYPEAYADLLKAGILIEEKRFSTAIPTEVVRFISKDVYTYFLFIQITEQFDYQSCKGFFEYILKTFSKENSLREHILNWSIRFCINRNEIAQLKNIFKLPFTNQEKNASFDFICYVSRYELSKPNANFSKLNVGIDFVDLMAHGRTMSQLYKETIKTISGNVLNEDIQTMLHVLECNIYLVDVDKASLQNTMHLLKRNYKRLNDLFPINPYDLILYFHNVLNSKPTESKNLEEKIIKLCYEIDKSKPHKNEDLTSPEVLCFRLVLMVLFSQKNYAECHRFIMAILNKYPNIFYVRYSVFSPFLLLYLGHTYLKLNYFKKAQRIMQFLDKIIASEYIYYTNFVLTGIKIFKATFYNCIHNYDQALTEIDSGLEIASKNDLRMLEISLILSKIDALKHTESSEEVSNAIKELLNFLHDHKTAMPEYSNLNGEEFEQTFKILKSYRRSQNC
ncbi:NACHT domain-containing protein [Pedobacter endophyticus]|uniref:NACHT domain-containing protein n=1 Tax=Pedobacter endophyticus TaxID=2789740 RepID=A0A7U3SPE2_9SPHI|nr:hypothetical protein [Pedobacter endophyticus]QPH38523.1 hypothetical protein IZT61_15725 [Pedobacter endophyticus]